ncbi:MAG: hypothetical protein Q8R11_02240 [bacterium]|nr:hypothetical protein [bacterium]
MVKGINLLPPDLHRVTDAWVARPVIIKVSTMMLALTAAFSIGVFGVRLLVDRQFSSIESNIAEKEAGISRQADKEALQLSLKDRLQAIRRLPSPSKEFLTTLTAFEEVFGGIGSVQNLSIQQDRIAFSVTVTEGAELITLLDTITKAKQPGTYFSSLSVESFGKNENGAYSFTVTAVPGGKDST